MANSRARSSKSKATSRRKAPAAAVVEEAPKGGLETGIAVLTALILVTAFMLVDFELGKSYGEGQFFKDKYAQAK
ncbi:MAG: hypothetical protein P8N31_05360 [Planctomycetota bacterium]|nr:hypothetical protein [Planctomycetota bacterium]MDG2142964.1 hypothetical protein [Planctomycetota bacterium]